MTKENADRPPLARPPAGAVEWSVFRKRSLLGTVTAQTWSRARDIAAAKFEVDRTELDVVLAFGKEP